jgi:hypothetical protein
MSIAEVEKMSTIERIQAMEVLWDALSHEEHEIESPRWHEKILLKRRERIESGETKFITFKQLKDYYRK